MSATVFRTRLETITPKEALKYLEQAHDGSVRNRGVSEALVKKFATIIDRGEWEVTHQGIAFDQDGKLIDGQHRLWACVEAKKNIQILVTRGMKSASMTVIDRGRSRSLGDILYIDGENNGSKKAAICRMLGAFIRGKGEGDPKFQRFTDNEIREMVAIYKPHLDWFCGLKVHGPFASAPLAACLVYAHAAAPSAVEALAEKLMLGTNLSPGDPMLAMRNHLIRNTTDAYLRRFSARMALMRAMFQAIAKGIKGEQLKRIDTDTMAGFDFIKAAVGNPS